MNAPSHGLLDSRGDFVDAVRRAFAEAADAGCRELWMADADYADWPLGERAVVEHLTRWALPHRKLTMLAGSFDDVARRHPRFAEWRRLWSHVIECRRIEDIEPDKVPSLLLAPAVVTVRLFGREPMRGSVSRAPDDALRCRELVDAISQRSVEAFPATTLGL